MGLSEAHGTASQLCCVRLVGPEKQRLSQDFFNAHKNSQVNHNITYCTDTTLNMSTRSRQCNYPLIDSILGYIVNLFILRPWRYQYLESEYYLGSPLMYQPQNLLSIYLALNLQKCCISLAKKSIKFILFCF